MAEGFGFAKSTRKPYTRETSLFCEAPPKQTSRTTCKTLRFLVPWHCGSSGPLAKHPGETNNESLGTISLHDQSLPYKYRAEFSYRHLFRQSLQALCFPPQIHTMAGNFTCLHLGNVIGHAVFFATVPLCMPQPAVDAMLLPLCIFAICHLVIFLVEDVRISCPNWLNLWSTFMPLELPGGEHSRNVFQPREPIPSCAVSLGEGPVN